jgi:DNA-formamidopyrimidine glycosylase
MPELPEVRRMCLDLSRLISGDTLESCEIMSGRYTKKQPVGWELISVACPSRLVGVGTHGKFSYILLSSGINIWVTMGMTGRLCKDRTKHTRIQFSLGSGKKFYFNDTRNFGTIKFVYGPNKLKDKLGKLGPDLFSNDITAKIFIKRFRERNNWNIAKAMMNQAVVAGIGNYIKAESLWLSEISPERCVDDLEDFELVLLYRSVRDVVHTSYMHNGETFLTHKNFSEKKGDYSCKFLCYNRIIDAEGNKVIKTQTPDGRTTHWAPQKQK